MNDVNAHLLPDLDGALMRARAMADTLHDNNVLHFQVWVGNVVVTVKRTDVPASRQPSIQIHYRPGPAADENVVQEVVSGK